MIRSRGFSRAASQLFRLEVVAQLFPDAHYGGAGIGAEELRCQLVLILRPFRSAHLRHALVHHGSQRAVGDVVGEGHGDLIFHLGAGHQGRAFSHVHHPGEQLLDLADLGGPDLVLDDGVALDHVGGGAAGIGIGVVDAGGVDHVLPQVVAAHVHQLHGVQSAAAQMGLSAGVGGDAVKGEVGAHDGHAAPGATSLTVSGCQV